MKTAVSIPDDIYQDAERLARRLNKPRSQIYADALKEYLARHDPDAIIAAINELCDDETVELRDPGNRGRIGRDAAARRMVISQREIWWGDLPAPAGSEPGNHRPLLIVQSDIFNQSRISTVVCVPVVGNVRLARFPGNVLLSQDATGLPWDSVANVSQIFAADQAWLRSLEGKIDQQLFNEVLAGIDLVLGR